MSTIVVGLDASPLAAQVLGSAIALAKDLRARLVLVHTFPRHFVPADVSPATAQRLEELEASTDAHEAVDLSVVWAAQARREGLDVVTETARGHPGDALLAAGVAHNAALLVVGRRSIGTFRRTLMGSFSSYVVRKADRPVLVVPLP